MADAPTTKPAATAPVSGNATPPTPVSAAAKPDVPAKPNPAVAAKAPAPELKAVEAQTKVAPALPPSRAKNRALPAPKAAEVASRKTAKPTTKPAASIAAPAKKDSKMDSMNNTAAGNTVDKAKDMMAQATERTRTAVDKGQKMLGEMNEFSKGNIEAIVESSKIAAKGMESMGQSAVAYARNSFEEATTAAKRLASVTSPTEFMKLQSDFVRASFDSMVAHTSKSTEAMLKLAGEVAQPISNRVSLAAEKVKVAA